MLELIIACILGLAVGFGSAWLIIHILPQQKIREINYERIQEEQSLLDKIHFDMMAYKQEHEDYLKLAAAEEREADKRCALLEKQKDVLEAQVVELSQRQLETERIVEEAERQARYAGATFYKQQMDLAQTNLDHSLSLIAQKFQEDEEECKTYYLSLLEDVSQDFLTQIKSLQEQSNEASQHLAQLQATVDAAVAAAKRAEEKRQTSNFYRLVLPESDLNEIAKLREVEPYLKDKEALNKVIWKVYYEKPYTDLIGRVVGSTIKTGIYKITNIENQMCYVGQATNIAERWRQHIKRGVGAEAPTRNKLYPAMLNHGVENFTFEIIEECSRDDLDAREDYWQDYFKAKEFGYSIK